MNKQQLEEFRSKLPYGAVKKIHEITGYSISYISGVLNGRYPINDENIKIFEEGKKITAEASKKNNDTQKKLDKIICQNS